MMRVEIWTDGSSGPPNPGGPGGWAAILRYGQHEREIAGAVPSTTNNRMELAAAVAALASLKRPCQVDLYTDSQYLQRGITMWLAGWAARGWVTPRGKAVANVDLWKQLKRLSEEHQVTWHWVRAHSGIELNERVNELARMVRA